MIIQTNTTLAMNYAALYKLLKYDHS